MFGFAKRDKLLTAFTGGQRGGNDVPYVLKVYIPGGDPSTRTLRALGQDDNVGIWDNSRHVALCSYELF